MKRWIGHALLTAGALAALLVIGRPASADLVGVTINSKGTASGGYAVVSGTITGNSVYYDHVFEIYVVIQQIVRGHVVAQGSVEIYDVGPDVFLTKPWSFVVPANEGSPP